MALYDPALYADSLSETPVEVEVVTTSIFIFLTEHLRSA